MHRTSRLFMISCTHFTHLAAFHTPEGRHLNRAEGEARLVSLFLPKTSPCWVKGRKNRSLSAEVLNQVGLCRLRE